MMMILAASNKKNLDRIIKNVLFHFIRNPEAELLQSWFPQDCNAVTWIQILSILLLYHSELLGLSSTCSLMTEGQLQKFQDSSRQNNNRKTALFKKSLLIGEETFLESCRITSHDHAKAITGTRKEITVIGQCRLLALGLKTTSLETYGNVEEDRHLNNNRVLLQMRKEE